MYGTRVVIASKTPTAIKQIKTILTKAGYLVIGEAQDGQRALQLIRSTQPDLVITEFTLPIMSGLELAQIIEDAKLATVMVLAAATERSKAKEAVNNKIYNYVVMPVEEGVLIPAIECALANFKRVWKMEQEINKLRETIESRKLIEKAKGILMQQFSMNEEEAFRKIQKQSMDKRTSMAAIAKALILSYEIHNS